MIVAIVGYREREGRLELLLVRTSSGRHWTFPKGHVDLGETPVEGAAREALEEAGAMGEADERLLAEYRYPSAPRGERVQAYLMKVESLNGQHEEGRDPTWFAPEAAKLRFATRGSKWAQEQEQVVDAAVQRLHEEVPH